MTNSCDNCTQISAKPTLAEDEDLLKAEEALEEASV
jgi:hypothetical protein